MRIYLVGFMGSGKTTIGKYLAERLKCRFIDFDELIESQEKQTITEIFVRKGEQFFRHLEQKAIKFTRDLNKVVIATGGGTPVFDRNMEYMNKFGLTIYLEVRPDQLFERLKNDKAHRPLIAEKSDDELQTFIKEKLHERLPFYELASYIVDGNLTPEEIYEQIKMYYM